VGLGVPDQRAGRPGRLIATSKLLPESRASERPALDLVGVGASIVGLVALIYGLIEAGQHGWSDMSAPLEMVGGLAMLVGFFSWERRLSRRPGGQPLIDVALFRSPSYTWGGPFLDLGLCHVRGAVHDAAVLPGCAGDRRAGLRRETRATRGRGGTGRSDRSYGGGEADSGARVRDARRWPAPRGQHQRGLQRFLRRGTWMALVGAGMGLALATATSAALSELSEERSGVGSAALQALNKMGGPLGTAILGSVLSSAYVTRLAVSGLPATAATAARQSIFGAAAVAHQIGSPALLDSARAAFVGGMDLALWCRAASRWPVSRSQRRSCQVRGPQRRPGCPPCTLCTGTRRCRRQPAGRRHGKPATRSRLACWRPCLRVAGGPCRSSAYDEVGG
jgi:hypothetical protein